MNAMVDELDLTRYSIDDLHKLGERIQKEINHKEQSRILDARRQMEEIAGQVAMTPEEVLAYDSRKKAPKDPSKIKYRNPANPEQTWTGRGKRPQWLKDALEQGATLEEFAVAS